MRNTSSFISFSVSRCRCFVRSNNAYGSKALMCRGVVRKYIRTHWFCTPTTPFNAIWSKSGIRFGPDVHVRQSPGPRQGYTGALQIDMESASKLVHRRVRRYRKRARDEDVPDLFYFLRREPCSLLLARSRDAPQPDFAQKRQNNDRVHGRADQRRSDTVGKPADEMNVISNPDNTQLQITPTLEASRSWLS